MNSNPAAVAPTNFQETHSRTLERAQFDPGILFELAPALSQAQLLRAARIARYIPSPAQRARVLTGIAARLGGDERARVIASGLEALAEDHSEDLEDVADAAFASRWLAVLGEEGELAARPDLQKAFESATAEFYLRLGFMERITALQEVLDELEHDWTPRRGTPGVLGIGEEKEQEGGVLPASQRYVSTGFARGFGEGEIQKRNMPLLPATTYQYWVTIGALDPHAIDRDAERAPLPGELSLEGTLLDVVLFPFKDELQIEADAGRFQVEGGRFIVARQPAAPDTEQAGRLGTHLFFPVRTPAHEGLFRLRCNIYYKQILVQSRIVRVLVVAQPTETPDALVSVLDYVLAQKLELEALKLARPHRLSLLMNDNEEGTHSLRFFGKANEGAGAGEIQHGSIELDGDTIENWLTVTREAFHVVSWGDKAEWDSNKNFRYTKLTPSQRTNACADAPRFGNLAADLGRLAVAGSSVYADFSGILGRPALEAIIYNPGAVQIALKAGARFVIPAAVIYDYPWDPDVFVPGQADFEICPEFSTALCGTAPLEDCKCFKGECPTKSKGEELVRNPATTVSDLGPVICPSGFWGFRHALGFPVCIRPALDESNASGDARPHTVIGSEIFYDKKPELALGISTDPQLEAYREHAIQLQALGWGNDWNPADTRSAVLLMLKSTKAQIIYFFCHGGRTASRNPFLDVGYNEKWLTPRTLANNKISFAEPHPLVFINGCHTVAVEQKVVLSFVSEFVYEQASGVIGTEVTVPDTLASQFAEECLRRFVVGQDYLGDAVRGARLAVLRDQLNPLGLIYTPFALESLRLLPKP